MYDRPLFLPAGDKTLVVELGDAIDPAINRRVHNLTQAIERAALPGVFDLVPTYRSLLVYYDPLTVSPSELQSRIVETEQMLDEQTAGAARVVHVPTLYGGEYGPDLGFVAQHAGLSTEAVVDIHSSTDYLVYMMGFTPGFPYLGGMSEKLTTPRLDTPRTEIPAGSVGIAENQTGVYPVASPGGWQLIGRTPLSLFDPLSDRPSLLDAGDYVRFTPIATEEEYQGIQRAVENREYQPATEGVS